MHNKEIALNASPSATSVTQNPSSLRTQITRGSSLTEKIWALLELGRVSNLPTCISNVLAGYWVGGGRFTDQPWALIGTVLAVCFAYESGIVLNDLVDEKTDSVERPFRPIPSGRIKRGAGWSFYLTFVGLSFYSIISFAPKAVYSLLALHFLILLYNFTHKAFKGGPLLMGLCRAMVYWIAATAAGWNLELTLTPLFMGLNLSFYILLLSLLAKSEAAPEEAMSLDGLLLPFNLVFILPILFNPPAVISGLALVFGWGWTFIHLSLKSSRRIQTSILIGHLISGISLLDAVVLASFGSLTGMILAWGCFAITVFGHRRIAGS